MRNERDVPSSWFVVLPFLAAFLLVGCQPQAAEPGPLAEEDGAAIRSAVDVLREAALAGDWATYAAQFTENGVAMPPNEGAVEGRQAIEEWASGYSVSAFTTQQATLEGRGDLAYRRGTYSITLTPPGMEEEATDQGKFVEIWREQEDGSWKIAVDIWNSNQSPPEAASSSGRQGQQKN